MNILITGANGQLGSEMRVLSAEHPRHACFFTDVQDLDICDEEAVRAFIAAHGIEAVVNCAAYTAVDKAETEPERAYRLNASAPGILARAAEDANAVLIHISTDYVFDGTAHLPYTEDMPTCPDSVYGTTKQEGERLVLTNCRRSVVVRTAWLYSSFGNNFVKTMLRLGKERDTLGVVFDQIGTPTYARDLARAVYAMLDKGIVNGVYHFSNEGVCSWYDFAHAVHRLGGVVSCRLIPLHTVEYPSPAKRPAYSVLDKTKIKTTYGIDIRHWTESLAECIDLLRE